jgi:hypothetical protein
MVPATGRDRVARPLIHRGAKAIYPMISTSRACGIACGLLALAVPAFADDGLAPQYLFSSPLSPPDKTLPTPGDIAGKAVSEVDPLAPNSKDDSAPASAVDAFTGTLRIAPGTQAGSYTVKAHEVHAKGTQDWTAPATLEGRVLTITRPDLQSVGLAPAVGKAMDGTKSADTPRSSQQYVAVFDAGFTRAEVKVYKVVGDQHTEIGTALLENHEQPWELLPGDVLSISKGTLDQALHKQIDLYSNTFTVGKFPAVGVTLSTQLLADKDRTPEMQEGDRLFRAAGKGEPVWLSTVAEGGPRLPGLSVPIPVDPTGTVSVNVGFTVGTGLHFQWDDQFPRPDTVTSLQEVADALMSAPAHVFLTPLSAAAADALPPGAHRVMDGNGSIAITGGASIGQTLDKFNIFQGQLDLGAKASVNVKWQVKGDLKLEVTRLAGHLIRVRWTRSASSDVGPDATAVLGLTIDPATLKAITNGVDSGVKDVSDDVGLTHPAPAPKPAPKATGKTAAKPTNMKSTVTTVKTNAGATLFKDTSGNTLDPNQLSSDLNAALQDPGSAVEGAAAALANQQVTAIIQTAQSYAQVKFTVSADWAASNVVATDMTYDLSNPKSHELYEAAVRGDVSKTQALGADGPKYGVVQNTVTSTLTDALSTNLGFNFFNLATATDSSKMQEVLVTVKNQDGSSTKTTTESFDQNHKGVFGDAATLSAVAVNTDSFDQKGHETRNTQKVEFKGSNVDPFTKVNDVEDQLLLAEQLFIMPGALHDAAAVHTAHVLYQLAKTHPDGNFGKTQVNIDVALGKTAMANVLKASESDFLGAYAKTFVEGSSELGLGPRYAYDWTTVNKATGHLMVEDRLDHPVLNPADIVEQFNYNEAKRAWATIQGAQGGTIEEKLKVFPDLAQESGFSFRAMVALGILTNGQDSTIHLSLTSDTWKSYRFNKTMGKMD